MTFEGTSVTEINAAFKDAVDDYIESCKRSAREPEKAFRGSFNVRVKPNIHRLVSLNAQALKVSLNQYVESVLEKAHPLIHQSDESKFRQCPGSGHSVFA